MNPIKKWSVIALTAFLLYLMVLSIATRSTFSYQTAAQKVVLEGQIKELEQQAIELNQSAVQLEMSLRGLYDRLLVSETGRIRADRITNGDILNLDRDDLISRTLQQGNRGGFRRPNAYEFDVTKPSAVTAKQLEKVFHGTGLSGLGESFVRAEFRYGINAVFFAALAAEESQWGHSYFSKDRNNLFGWGAFTSNPNAAIRFKSKEECIMTVAEGLRDDYVARGLLTIDRINSRYASNELWGRNIANIMATIVRDVN